MTFPIVKVIFWKSVIQEYDFNCRGSHILESLAGVTQQPESLGKYGPRVKGVFVKVSFVKTLATKTPFTSKVNFDKDGPRVKGVFVVSVVDKRRSGSVSECRPPPPQVTFRHADAAMRQSLAGAKWVVASPLDSTRAPSKTMQKPCVSEGAPLEFHWRHQCSGCRTY